MTKTASATANKPTDLRAAFGFHAVPFTRESVEDIQCDQARLVHKEGGADTSKKYGSVIPWVRIPSDQSRHAGR